MNTMYWYNFKTGGYEYRDTPAELYDYIPQDNVSQGIYAVKLKLGSSHLESANYVLQKWAEKGMKSNEPQAEPAPA